MSNTKDLINAIIDGSALDTETAFNDIMAEKISSRLEDLKMSVASNMFKSEEVVAEEAEQIDELKNSTMSSYVKKASMNAVDMGYQSGTKPYTTASIKLNQKADKRLKGIGRAVDKLAKEEVEQVDEARAMDYKMSRSGVAGDRGNSKGGDITVPQSQKDEIAKIFAKKEKVKEEVEQVEEEHIEERNKENAMMRKSMDASRGARFKAQGNAVPDPEPEHKTGQAHNKAIGRALRQMTR